VKKCNEDDALPGKLIIEAIGEGLTSIMQVPDVAVNKVRERRCSYTKLKRSMLCLTQPFKHAFRERYHMWREEMESKKPARMQNPPKVAREDFIRMLEETIQSINETNKLNPFIAASFVRLGQNPWSSADDLAAFNAYLDRLELNDVLRTMNNSSNRGLKLT
jgi:hypothetical protein